MSLEELFRVKLENAEIIPSFSAGDKLMRRLRHREFMRFNPARFNVYYLGAIIAGMIAAGVLLFSDDDNKNNSETVLPGISQVTSELSIPSGNAIRPHEDNPLSEAKEPRNEKIVPPAVVTKDPVEPSRGDASIKQATVDGSLREKISITSTSNSRLQEKSVSNEPLFIPSVISGCAPLKVNFNLNKVSFESYSWSFGDDGHSNAPNPGWVFERGGDYNVILNAVLNGRTYSHSALIKVYAKPSAGFTLSPEKPIIPDDEVSFINYSTNAVSYNWNFGDGSSSTMPEPRHRYKEFGNFTVSLKIKSEDGCVDSAILSKVFTGPEYFITMPNAFIPNSQGPSGGFYSSKSDESAEIFHPMYSGVNEYHLIVYSKLGMVLFESKDINIGWDGYYKGQLSNPGVYIWKVTGSYRNGVTFSRMGDVTLLKNDQ